MLTTESKKREVLIKNAEGVPVRCLGLEHFKTTTGKEVEMGISFIFQSLDFSGVISESTIFEINIENLEEIITMCQQVQREFNL